MDVEVLTEKGAIENLIPYLEKSDGNFGSNSFVSISFGLIYKNSFLADLMLANLYTSNMIVLLFLVVSLKPDTDVLM